MKDRLALAKHFADMGFKKGAEVGVLEGLYSKLLLDNIPELNLLSVDSWSLSIGWGLKKHKRAYHVALDRLLPYPSCTILRGLSVDVSRAVIDESLDFVYIDADHSYEAVKADINAWAPKVKSGGVVAGHDYYDNPDKTYGEFGVIRAVDEYVKENNVELKLSSDDEPFLSWYFIKT